MNINKIATIIILLTFVSGCTRWGAENSQTQIANLGQGDSSATVAPIMANDIAAFIDKQAASQLSEKELNEAASAQFYALQFGRVGAPRVWQGDSGATGRVFVGPFVRVNQLNCRQFTHVVTISGTDFERKGTACREVNGNWDVVDS